jgi:hypothetical protein
MSRRFARIYGTCGIVAAALAAFAFPSAQQDEQDTLNRELEQRLVVELQMQPPLRHIGDFFPPGR